MKRLLALALLLWLPAAGTAEEYYFVTVFGSQRRLKQPDHAHSYAVFVRLYGEGCDLSKYKMEYFTISWLPATLQVRLWACRPEEGVNLDLHSTMHWALDDRRIVAYWGPYQITPDFYARAYRGAGLLNGGAVRYKAADTGYDTARVSNCIHACSDLAEGQPRLRIASPGWGHSASYAITVRYRDGIVDYDTTYPWILHCLGLSGYEMQERDFSRGNPTIAPVMRTLQNINRFSFR
jgi:hypothetical protein